MFENAEQKEGESKGPSHLFTSGNSSTIEEYGGDAYDENGQRISYKGFDTLYHTHPQGTPASETDMQTKEGLKKRGVTNNYVLNPHTGKIMPY